MLQTFPIINFRLSTHNPNYWTFDQLPVRLKVLKLNSENFEWKKNKHIFFQENAFNSLKLGDTISHKLGQWSRSSLVLVNACYLFKVKPSPEPIKLSVTIIIFNENLFEIQTFSFKKMSLKLSSAKYQPFCIGLNVLTATISHFFGFVLSRSSMLLTPHDIVCSTSQPTLHHKLWNSLQMIAVYRSRGFSPNSSRVRLFFSWTNVDLSYHSSLALESLIISRSMASWSGKCIRLDLCHFFFS